MEKVGVKGGRGPPVSYLSYEESTEGRVGARQNPRPFSPTSPGREHHRVEGSGWTVDTPVGTLQSTGT